LHLTYFALLFHKPLLYSRHLVRRALLFQDLHSSLTTEVINASDCISLMFPSLCLFVFRPLSACFTLKHVTMLSSACSFMNTMNGSATPWNRNDRIIAALRRLMSWLHISGSYPSGSPQVRAYPYIARPPSILDPFAYRISGFSSSRLLTHGSSLKRVHFHLSGKFDSCFLQIPHWPCHCFVSHLWSFDLVSLDTLAFVYIFPPIRAKVNLSLTRIRPCWAHE